MEQTENINWINAKSLWPQPSGLDSSLHFYSPWQLWNKSTIGLIFSDMLTRRVIMSPKPGIYGQNFDFTKHHLMKSPGRKRNIKYFSLG